MTSYRQDLNFFPSQLSLSNTTFGVVASSEMGDGVHDRKRKSTMSLNLAGDESDHEDVIQNPAAAAGRTIRGHWRPAEDSKLKQLVAQFGPQNWNLIAEHLDGRSGNRSTQTSFIFWRLEMYSGMRLNVFFNLCREKLQTEVV